MASEKDNQWIFTKEQLAKSPSRKHVDPEKELGYRQQAANLIQDMGQRLSVNQLTINTAIVYMHRFYMYHSFTVFSRYAIAPTALFLAAKVEEQPKKLEHVLKICYTCLHPDKPHLDTHSDNYLKQAQELVQNELVLLQTLGFDISVDHPHTHVVKCAQLVKASRDLSQMAYFMATNSLHLTRFCLLYKPTVVAAMCIHLSCKWSNYEIPLSSDGKAYWSYMDPCITEPLLDTIVKEFLQILNRCPTRLRKLKNYRPSNDKEESKEKETKVQQPPATQTVTSQPSSAVPTSSNSKEKKPMSLEEYKRTHTKQQVPQKASHPTSALHPNHHKQTHPPNQGPPKHPDSRAHIPHGSLHQRDPNKPQPHPLPHPDQHHRNQTKHGQRPMDPNARPNPPPHPNSHSQQRQAYEMQKQAKEAQRNMMTSGQHKTKPPNANPVKSNDVAEIDAVSKDLEGRIRSEKTHLPSAEQHSHHRSATHPSSGQNVAPSSKSTSQEAARRHHSDKGHEAPHSHQRPVKEFKQYSRKALYEMYQKNPEKLRVYLKHKAQSTPLSEDERPIYKKLQAMEEEHRKRKEKQQKSKIENLPTPAASPGGGNLTLRIKLPGNSSGEPNPNTSVAKIIGSSSGSGSEASPVRSRKRGHGTEQAEHTAAKHSRRSEDHHKHHRSSGNGSSSGGSHKHKRHHKHHSRSKNEHIDEAVFQKSLSAAISKVQQQQIPTVTLKKAANGGDGATYFASSHTKADLDAAAPVSSTMPDDIFEDDIDSGMGGTSSQVATLESTHSTPEPGEIKDDTPPPPIHPQQQKQRWNAGKKFDNPTQGLFSPQSDSGDQKRSSSGFGYHSNNENEFASPPPPLMRKPVQ